MAMVAPEATVAVAGITTPATVLAPSAAKVAEEAGVLLAMLTATKASAMAGAPS